jgi:hypothetical protein
MIYMKRFTWHNNLAFMDVKKKMICKFCRAFRAWYKHVNIFEKNRDFKKVVQMGIYIYLPNFIHG